MWQKVEAFIHEQVAAIYYSMATVLPSDMAAEEI
jgi:hypothetical protein